MALDLWFRQDVQRMLNSIARTAAVTGASAEPEYMRGFHDALLAVAEGFGLTEPQIEDRVTNQYPPERRVD